MAEDDYDAPDDDYVDQDDDKSCLTLRRLMSYIYIYIYIYIWSTHS